MPSPSLRLICSGLAVCSVANSQAGPPANCTALGEQLCTADGNCAAFGTYGSSIQLHGCVITVANPDWTIFVRDDTTGTYSSLPGTVNIDEDACPTHPNTGVAHACTLPSPLPILPSPTPPPFVNMGSFDAGTGESSIQWWGPDHRLVVMESIFCGYWDHAGQYDPSFADHSYFRVRDFSTGAVISNISLSIGFGFGSGFVDHAEARFWIFGTPHDRCNHPVMNSTDGVYAFWSDDLLSWQRARTDVAWSGPNTDVGRVYGSPPGLPPHRYVMITEGATFAINNNADGNLTTGWTTLGRSYGVPGCPEGCQCPSIRFLPSDGHYYILTGGHNIWLLRSPDLQHWEQPPSERTPFIAPSLADGQVADGFVGNPATIAESDDWFLARGLNTTTEMLQHLTDWDWNSNDADMCCESWGGASEVTRAYFNWGPSSQGARPRGNLTGPSCMQALGVGNATLDVVLQSYFLSSYSST